MESQGVPDPPARVEQDNPDLRLAAFGKCFTTRANFVGNQKGRQTVDT